MKIDDIKNFIQSANFNFLFGAGLSDSPTNYHTELFRNFVLDYDCL